jgi:hypothetical protein
MLRLGLVRHVLDDDGTVLKKNSINHNNNGDDDDIEKYDDDDDDDKEKKTKRKKPRCPRRIIILPYIQTRRRNRKRVSFVVLLLLMLLLSLHVLLVYFICPYYENINQQQQQQSQQQLQQQAHAVNNNNKITNNNNNNNKRNIEFIVAGFPKCGTTTLLYSLNRLKSHGKIQMPEREACVVKDDWRDEALVQARLEKEQQQQQDLSSSSSASTSSSSSSLLYGMKCPTAIYNPHVVVRRLQQQQQQQQRTSTANTTSSTTTTKWIIGLRHPLQQLLSYYNYRVTELYDKKRKASSSSSSSSWLSWSWWRNKLLGPGDTIPTLQQLYYFANDDDDDDDDDEIPMTWKDMSIFSHRYEIFLMQLLLLFPAEDHESSSTPPSSLSTWERSQLDHYQKVQDAWRCRRRRWSCGICALYVDYWYHACRRRRTRKQQQQQQHQPSTTTATTRITAATRIQRQQPQPLPPQVFLYTVDQLQDDNVTRSRQFRRDLLSFLGLVLSNETKNSDEDDIINAFQLGRENINRFTSEQQTAHAETIRLCHKNHGNKNEKEYDNNNNNNVMPEALRRRFLAESRITAEWMEQRVLRLLQSQSSSSSSSSSTSSSWMTVSNPQHFLQSLQAWKVDPCSRLPSSSSSSG